MQRFRHIGWIVLFGLFCAGCGRHSSTPSTPSPSNATVSVETESVSTALNKEVAPVVEAPAVEPPPVVEVVDEAFEAEIRKVLALEQDADFAAAFQLCRTLKETYKIPSQAKRLNLLTLRVIKEKKESAELMVALRNLTSGKEEYVRVAEQKLSDSKETACILLRKALQTEPDETALPVARLLVDLMDTNALPVFTAQFAVRTSLPLREVFAEGIKALAGHLSTNQLASFYQLILSDTNFTQLQPASILEAAFRKRGGCNAAQFNKMVGAADGFENLRAYFEKALLADDTNLVFWACEYGGSLIGLFHGAIGQYYTDPAFMNLATQRVDAQILAEDNRFPLPVGQRNNVSVRWSARLEIPKPGKYTFYAQANTHCVVSVNNQTVVDCRRGDVEVTGTVVLPAGLVSFQADYVCQDSPRNFGVRVSWSGPDQPKQLLDSLALRTPPGKEAILQIRPDIRKLDSANAAEAQDARARLLLAGDVGNIYLREALQNESDQRAACAAELLAAQQDRRACAPLLARIEKNPSAPQIAALTSALCDLAAMLDAAQIQHLYQAMLQDTEATMLPHAAALCAILKRVCGDNHERFAGLVGEPKSYDQLKAYVARACVSSNDAVVLRAGQFGAPFVADAPGLHGRYFLGTQWGKLATERLDASINFPRQKYPVPDQWQKDLSARWSGTLLVNQPGSYVFYLQRQRATATLLLDGQELTFQSVPGGKDLSSSTIVLAKGEHRINLESQNSGEWNHLSLLWSGPGFDRQVIPPDVLRTPLWESELAKFPGAVSRLASADQEEAGAASDFLLQAGSMGKIFLSNAIRFGPDPVVKAAARALAGQKDSSIISLLLERARKTTDAAIVADILMSLRDCLTSPIPPDIILSMSEAVANDKEARMIPEACVLCMVLDNACGGREADFNKLARNPKAYAQLKAYVEQAGASSNQDVVLRVCLFGAPFVEPAHGLRGRYYHGAKFDDLVLDRLDKCVDVPSGKFPSPDKRQTNVSARWSGTLVVRQAGDYIFDLNTSGRQRVILDGQELTFDGNWRGRTNKVSLTSGMHAILVERQQAEHYIMIRMEWTGPNIKRQLIDAESLRVPLWPEELAKLPAAINNLASTNAVEAAAAREQLLQSGGAGKLLLKHAVRFKPAPVAKAAAKLLAP